MRITPRGKMQCEGQEQVTIPSSSLSSKIHICSIPWTRNLSSLLSDANRLLRETQKIQCLTPHLLQITLTGSSPRHMLGRTHSWNLPSPGGKPQRPWTRIWRQLAECWRAQSSTSSAHFSFSHRHAASSSQGCPARWKLSIPALHCPACALSRF